jgi:hypothetical protein
MMTDEEMLTALIHIKRHIYSKPVKKYITDVIARIKTAQSSQQYRAGLYQVAYKMPLYDSKNTVHVDVKV